MKVCTKDGCDKKVLARGLCEQHYHEAFRHDRYLRHRKNEIESAIKRNKEKRDAFLSKIGFTGNCQICSSPIDTSKKRSVFIVGDVAMCAKCWNENRKVKKFSKESPRCAECGSKYNKHAGQGLCVKCYSEKRRNK